MQDRVLLFCKQASKPGSYHPDLFPNHLFKGLALHLVLVYPCLVLGVQLNSAINFVLEQLRVPVAPPRLLRAICKPHLQTLCHSAKCNWETAEGSFEHTKWRKWWRHSQTWSCGKPMRFCSPPHLQKSTGCLKQGLFSYFDVYFWIIWRRKADFLQKSTTFQDAFLSRNTFVFAAFTLSSYLWHAWD